MRIILLPLSFIFRIIVWFRNFLYNYEILNEKSLSCKVISVGNISAGGTGKTPMVEYVAEYFINRKKSVNIILKGYKRIYDDIQVAELGYRNSEGKLNNENFGDEALMLLDNLPKTENATGLLITSDDKVRGAKFADSKFKPDVIIIDDGFHLRNIYKDLDIVMVNPLEKKLLLPAGNLREPYKNIKRADLVIFNHKFNKNINLLRKGNMAETADCSYKLVNFLNVKNDVLPKETSRAVVFCGIGDPESFKDLIINSGFEICDFIKFSDHHSYSKNDADKIISSFKNKNADCIITTQKDFVRLKYPQKPGTELQKFMHQILINYPLYYANIKLQILKNEQLITEKLEKLLREMN